MPQCALGVEMAAVTLGEAARLTRLNKSTVSRAVKSGRLSATRRDDGSFLVDIAELERVFTIRAAPAASPTTDAATGCEHQGASRRQHPSAEVRIATLEAELRGAREVLAE